MIVGLQRRTRSDDGDGKGGDLKVHLHPRALNSSSNSPPLVTTVCWLQSIHGDGMPSARQPPHGPLPPMPAMASSAANMCIHPRNLRGNDPAITDRCRRIRFDLPSPSRGHERFLRGFVRGLQAPGSPLAGTCSFCCACVFFVCVWSLACFPVIRGEGSAWLPVLLPRPRFGRSRRRVSLLCSAPLNFVTVAVRTAHTSGRKRKWSKLSRELVWMRV